MTKFSASIVLILGLSFTMRAYAQATCQVDYYGPNPDPTCQTVQDENGEDQQVCQAVGAPIAVALLDDQNDSFQTDNFPLEGISLNGACNCVVELFSEPNYGGPSLRYPTEGAESTSIVNDEVWLFKTQSFEVDCDYTDDEEATV